MSGSLKRFYCRSQNGEFPIDHGKRVEMEDTKQEGLDSYSLDNNASQVNKRFEEKDSDTDNSVKSDHSPSSKRKAWECAGIVEEKCHPNPSAKRDSLETMVLL